MAKALQCPACGAKHPVSDLPDAETLRCECGRSLKIPAQFRSRSAPAAPAAPRPRTVTHVGRDATSVLPTPAAAAPEAVPSRRRDGRARPEGAPDSGRRPVPLVYRLLAWAVALPLGLAIVAIPARQFGWLSGDRLVDVFTTGTGLSRYFKPRVLLLAPVWALATALLVTLFVEGGRWLADRRRATQAARATERGSRRPDVDAEARSSSDRRGNAAPGPERPPRRMPARRGGP